MRFALVDRESSCRAECRACEVGRVVGRKEGDHAADVRWRRDAQRTSCDDFLVLLAMMLRYLAVLAEHRFPRRTVAHYRDAHTVHAYAVAGEFLRDDLARRIRPPAKVETAV